MANVSSGTYVVEDLGISFDALDHFASLLPSSTSKIVERARGIIATLQRVPATRKDVVRFQDCLLRCLPLLLSTLYELTIGDQGTLTIPAGTESDVDHFERLLSRIQNKLSDTLPVITAPQKGLKPSKKDFVARPQTSLLCDCMDDLLQAIAPFEVKTDFTHAARLCNVARKAQSFTADPHIETLPQAKYARFNCERPDRPAGCLKGTRIGVIRDAIAWITDPGHEAKRFFLLNGLAGTGKTTIAHSIASIAQHLGILGATFFFSRRGESTLRDPALVFPTIAHQLALFDQTFCRLMTAALRDHPLAPTASLKEQLDSLIIQPLSGLVRADEGVVIIIFDAFDECEDVGAKIILQLLVHAIPRLPIFLKIFVTSRPEAHIRSVLLPSNNRLQITALHEIESSVVQRDILHYLRTEIRKMPKKKGVDLPLNWVTEVQIELLARAAGELFIYAATLLRSLEEAFSLPQQLEDLLEIATKPRSEDKESNPFVYLDELYLEVLLRPVTRSNKAQVLGLLQVVLGSIVLLRDPLPVDALERLTGMRTGDAVATLNSFHSVILPPTPPDHCPRTYHKSFSDFLQDPARCTDPDLFIKTEIHETRMAICCLKVLNTKLRKAMLGDLDPTLLNSQVQDLKMKVDNAFIYELQYACRHWASHLAIASHDNAELKMVLEEFASKKMLAWAESLGWLESPGGGITSLQLASTWAAKAGVFEAKIRLLDEGIRLLLAHSDTIALSSQQVWQSVLPFAPLNGEIASNYSISANTGVRLIQGFDSDWPLSRLPSENHSKVISSITFSPNGSRIASGSYDSTVRLWDATTGISTATLTDHSGYVTSVIFSPDGTHLASGSWDKTVKLWDATAGVSIATLTGHSLPVASVTFSLDGTQIASGSYDYTVRLWDATTGMTLAILTGHSLPVTSVAFSPKSGYLASGSYDSTVRLWDTTTGLSTTTLTGHSAPVTSVTFSPDGNHLQSQDRVFRVFKWNIHTGVRAENLDLHESDDRGWRGTDTFKYKNRRLYWTPNHGPGCLVCFLPPGADVRALGSRRLQGAIDVVAIGCGTGRVIIMHIQLPHMTDTQ